MEKIKIAAQSILISIGLNFTFFTNVSFEQSLKSSTMKSAVFINLLAVIIFYVIYTNNSFLKKKNYSIMQWIVSLFLAFNQIFRIAISSTGGLQIIFSSIPKFLISVVILYTYTYIFNNIQLILEKLLTAKNDLSLSEEKKQLKVNIWLDKHPFIFTIVVMIVCWMPVVIINYPSILVVDAFRQLLQYYGEIPITNAHPPIHTIILGGSVSLGRKFGSANLGLFISNLPQIIITLVGFSLTSVSLNRLNSSYFFKWLNVIIGAISPAVLGMLLVSTKDLLFSSFVLITYNIVVLYLSRKKSDFKYNVLYAIIFVLVATLVILFRKNGIYMILPLIPIVFIKAIFDIIKGIKHSRNSKIITTAILLILLILPIVISKKTDQYLENKYNMVEDVKKSEMLSIPFQQTARFVRDFPDDVSEKEEETIRKVVNFDSLAQNYTPHVSDKVKRTTPEDVTNEEIIEYFKVWFTMFWKHPLTYIESTAAQNYFLFSPENLNQYYTYLEDGYYKRADVPEGDSYKILMNKLGIKSTEEKMGMQDSLLRVYKVIDSIPILNLISNFSFAVMILLMVFALSIKQKKYKTLILTLPMLMLLLTIFAGPIVKGYVRYGLPFIFVTPILLGFFSYEFKED